MGRGSDPWDDSPLMDAFDEAMAKFKAMHKETYLVDSPKEEKETCDINENNPVVSEQITRHVELGEKNHDISSRERETDVPCTTDTSTEVFPVQADNLRAPEPQVPSTGYTEKQTANYYELLREFYELEEKKQKVVQQLHESSYWNYQIPVKSSSFQAHPESAASKHGQQTACPLCLPNGGCVYYPVCTACCSASQPHQYFVDPTDQSSQLGSDAARTGITAAERDSSSMGMMAPVVYNGYEAKEKGNDKEQSSAVFGGEGFKPDLTTVLNAWYAAGYHTGRYMLEQSKRS